ncbi:type II toxin-antitoxin system VapC family toxin [Brevundimonas sp. VNH65]|uniref:type II toxin-antitoxin system VapC family toxin n=1 Tax=Brevundimonas sp. VNH65 TaxID=3400917 RepID=UPI003C0C0254
MILVDSSVWIDFFNGRDTPEATRLDLYLGVQPVAVGDLILTEVLQGFRSDRDFDRARILLSACEPIEIGGVDLAVQAARNFRRLRALGVTVRKTIDCLIATRCIESGHDLLYSDRDFDPFVAHLGMTTA